jgi:hypothetical protein
VRKTRLSRRRSPQPQKKDRLPRQARDKAKHIDYLNVDHLIQTMGVVSSAGEHWVFR